CCEIAVARDELHPPRGKASGHMHKPVPMDKGSFGARSCPLRVFDRQGVRQPCERRYESLHVAGLLGTRERLFVEGARNREIAALVVDIAEESERVRHHERFRTLIQRLGRLEVADRLLEAAEAEVRGARFVSASARKKVNPVRSARRVASSSSASAWTYAPS